MASLKEVKHRILSVQNTRKITQARQMISAAELHRAQIVMENARSYRRSLVQLCNDLDLHFPKEKIPFSETEEKKPVAVVIFSSNTGMIGAFNARIIKELPGIADSYPGREAVFYPVGKKIHEAVLREGYRIGDNFNSLMDRTTYEEVAKVSQSLLESFRAGEFSQIDIVGYHYISTSRHEIVRKTLLPYSQTDSGNPECQPEVKDDYILEPSIEELSQTILSMLVREEFYLLLTETKASEHAERMIAMQLATENADSLLEELQRTYNKLRQQNITSELLDIVGSSFA